MTVLERLDVRDYYATATSLSQEFLQTAVERDRTAGAPDLEIKRLREGHLLSLTVPQDYGGPGVSWQML